jgi:hypothetical protein
MNTLGAIVGTVVAGFALVPLVGAQGAVKVAIALNLALGLAMLLAAGAMLAPAHADLGLAYLGSGNRWRRGRRSIARSPSIPPTPAPRSCAARSTPNSTEARRHDDQQPLPVLGRDGCDRRARVAVP